MHKHSIVPVGDNVVIQADCIECHKTITMHTTAAGYDQWQSGDYIQSAMPELTVGERELLISGVCDRCFDRIMCSSDVDDYY